MKIYVYCLLVMLALSVLAQVIFLVTGAGQRTPANTAFDLAVNVILIGWGTYVLGVST